MKFFVALGVLAYAMLSDAAGVSMHNPHFCYITDPIRFMTTIHSKETAYEAIRRFDFPTVNPTISTCTTSRFWYLGQHGSRFPHAEMFQIMIDFAESSIQDDIVSNYYAGRTTLCIQDFEAIRNWRRESNFIIENASFLTESGVPEMQNIARRYQQYFPNILTENYSPDRFHFRHAYTERSNRSIRAFANGIFGETGSENVIYEDVPEIDWFLRSFDFCPLFDQQRPEWSARHRAFEHGPEFEEMLEQVSSKLGFYGSDKLSLDTVIVMWNWCRFETHSTFQFSNSNRGGNSTWCAPFSVAHHYLLEYDEDLSMYYSTGYGDNDQRMVQNLNCGWMQDLLTHMQSDDITDTMARIFVTDSEAIELMLVLLGTFRDTWPLLTHNFAQQIGRNYRSSLLVPMASNLAVIRYDCDDGDHDLYFILNERPLLIPGCNQENGICKLSVIVNRFQRFIDADCEVGFCSSD